MFWIFVLPGVAGAAVLTQRVMQLRYGHETVNDHETVDAERGAGPRLASTIGSAVASFALVFAIGGLIALSVDASASIAILVGAGLGIAAALVHVDALDMVSR